MTPQDRKRIEEAADAAGWVDSEPWHYDLDGANLWCMTVCIKNTGGSDGWVTAGSKHDLYLLAARLLNVKLGRTK